MIYILYSLFRIDSKKQVYFGEFILLYKPDSCGFDSRWCQCNFLLTYSFRSDYGPGVDSASNRNEYQGYFLGVKAAGA
jgi:hypothetical protein